MNESIHNDKTIPLKKTSRIKQFVKIGIVFVLITLALFVSWLAWAPLPKGLYNNHYARIVLSREGVLLDAQIAADHQWRFAPLDELPQKYQQALLVFEDKHFFYHIGFDPLALGRAFITNLRRGRVVSGGSTLTMQLARMVRQDNFASPPPRNLFSKIVELAMALQFEWRLSKIDILRAYADHAPFGGNTTGLHAAAWRYFGRSPEQLSWAEAAVLAVLPNSPSLIHLGRQRELLQKKRDHLLNRLHAQQIINEVDWQLALLEPLPIKPQPLPQFAPHLLTRLINENPQQTVFHSTIQFAQQQRLIAIATQHSQHMANEGVNNIALLVIDHQQMQTIAYVGNHAWQNAVQYAPDVDIVNKPRSTGSILKPLLFASMLQDGELLPTTLVPDIPTQFGSFTPQNYDRQFRGAVPAQQALAQSLNIPAVHMLRQYGVNRFREQLINLGMSNLFRPADDYGLTLILGGAESSLWDITGIYARLIASARDGTFVKQKQRVAFLQDETISTQLPVIHQGASWLTLEAMLEVARPGMDSLWRDYQGSQQIAWKTGTSYGLRDGWAIGSNGKYTVGVWAGNAGGEPAPALTGSATAAPIMFDIFDSLGASAWLAKPEAAFKTVKVCVDDGYLAGGQCAARDIQIPIDSHFQTVTPHHKRVHLDAQQQRRVHSGCAAVNTMRNQDWFVLPAAQEYFWRQHHSDYQSLPPWRTDCIADIAAIDDDQPMDVLYPHLSSQIYLPIDLNGVRTRALLRAIHRNNNAKIFWHLDDIFLGETKVFHEQSVALEPGMHKLLLLDEQGYKLQRWFKVLGDDEKKYVR